MSSSTQINLRRHLLLHPRPKLRTNHTVIVVIVIVVSTGEDRKPSKMARYSELLTASCGLVRVRSVDPLDNSLGASDENIFRRRDEEIKPRLRKKNHFSDMREEDWEKHNRRQRRQVAKKAGVTEQEWDCLLVADGEAPPTKPDP